MITPEAKEYVLTMSSGATKTERSQVDELIKAAESLPVTITKGDVQAASATVLGEQSIRGAKKIATLRDQLVAYANINQVGRPNLTPLQFAIACIAGRFEPADRDPLRALLKTLMDQGRDHIFLTELISRHGMPDFPAWTVETARQVLALVEHGLDTSQQGTITVIAQGEVTTEEIPLTPPATDDEPPFMEASPLPDPETLLGNGWKHIDNGATYKVTAIFGFGEETKVEVVCLDDPALPPLGWSIRSFLDQFVREVPHPDQLPLIPNPEEVGASLEERLVNQEPQDWPPELLRKDTPAYKEVPPCPTAPAATTEPPSESPAEAPATVETGSSSSSMTSSSESQATAPSESAASDTSPAPTSPSSATPAAPASEPLTFPSAERLAVLRSEESELAQALADLDQQRADLTSRLDKVRSAIAEEERFGEKRRKREELLAQLAALDAELEQTA